MENWWQKRSTSLISKSITEDVNVMLRRREESSIGVVCAPFSIPCVAGASGASLPQYSWHSAASF